jgi:hypothetical protein
VPPRSGPHRATACCPPAPTAARCLTANTLGPCRAAVT